MGSTPSWHDSAVPDEDLRPGPELHTLRAVVELDLALDSDVAVDAAHAVVSDLADRAFGRGWQRGTARPWPPRTPGRC